MAPTRFRADSSPLVTHTGGGQVQPFAMTTRDRVMLRALTRWYTMTASQLVRHEANNPSLTDGWQTPNRYEVDPYLGAPADSFVRGGTAWQQATKRRNRLSRMARIAEFPGDNIGPFVDAHWLDRGERAWSATPVGAAFLGLHGWVKRPVVNEMYMRHAMAACDIGTQLEGYGYTVMSEREVSRSMLLDGTDIHAKLITESAAGHASPRRQITPDMAILSSNQMRYIAVEIERDRDRPVRTYVDKLTAYQGNMSIESVWYVCASKVTANRVATAVEKVFGPNTHARVRVRVADQRFEFWHLPYLSTDDNPEQTWDMELGEDLARLQQPRERAGILYSGR